MLATVTPNRVNVFNVLGDFLEAILPAGFKAVVGQANRVPEVAVDNFAVMWPIMTPRLATNIDVSVDGVFTGSITGANMTISAVNPNFTGKLAPGLQVFGVGLAANTVVVSQTSGTPGGLGVYVVSPSQTVGSETLAAGTQSLMQTAKFVIQVDIHGKGAASNASDNAQIFTTLFRDDFGVESFQTSNVGYGLPIDCITPLYTDDPQQLPFLNAEQQDEDRFSITTHIEVNETVVIGQQFADQLELNSPSPPYSPPVPPNGLINVDVVFPPS